MYIIATGYSSTSTSPYSALRHTSASTSPYCTLRHCPRSHFFLNYITILHFMSLFWVTLFLQVHRHRGRYVTVLGHTFFYKYIAILHSTSLPWVTLLLQIHYRIQHHCSWSSFPISTHNHTPHYITLLSQVLQYTAFYITALCDTSFTTSTSPYSALRQCPRSHFFLKYITILHCSGPHFFYKYIATEHTTSPSWDTLFLQVHRHTALYITALCRTSSTSTLPYCA